MTSVSPELGGRRPEDLARVEDERQAPHVLRRVVVSAGGKQEQTLLKELGRSNVWRGKGGT